MGVLADPNIYKYDRPSSYDALVGSVSPLVPSLSAASATAGEDIFACACLTVPVASSHMVLPMGLGIQCTPGFSIIAASANNFQLADATLVPNGIMPHTPFGGGANGDYGGVMSSLGSAAGNAGVPFTGFGRISQGIYTANTLPQGFQRMNWDVPLIFIPQLMLQTLYANQVLCVRSWNFPFSDVNKALWQFKVNWCWKEAVA